MNLKTLFTSIFMTVAGKIISALGVGFVSYAGLDYMQGRFAGWVSEQLGNFPADALQIFYIAGGGVALNWFFGAFTFMASLKATSHLTASLRK